MTKRLSDEQPILVLPKLASVIGLNEAIFLQQLQYWLERSQRVRDGHKWVYNTYENWQQQFPFWSVSTIRRIVMKLEEAHLIVVGNYNQLKLDKTKWYRINYEMLSEFVEWNNPDSQDEKKLNRSFVQNEAQVAQDCDTLESELNKAIPEITSETTSEITPEKKEDDHNNACEMNPFNFFEQNGFGTVGGYIAEKILAWCRDLSDELVVEAMKCAVEYGSKNWKYVETILRLWADRGYQRMEDVQADRLAFREKKVKTTTPTTGRDIYKRFKLDLTAGEDPE